MDFAGGRDKEASAGVGVQCQGLHEEGSGLGRGGESPAL